MSYQDKECRDLRAFNARFGVETSRKPTLLVDERNKERMYLIDEEADELFKAFQQRDVVEIADALIDLAYVIKGTAVMMGLPWEELWTEVHQTNMAKVRKTTDRAKIDVQKPEGWKPPDVSGILKSAGWEEDNG